MAIEHLNWVNKLDMKHNSIETNNYKLFYFLLPRDNMEGHTLD